MIIDWIALGIFGLAVVISAIIVWRKLPQLASIRIDSIPKFQQSAKKQQILDQRLQQKLGHFESQIGVLLKKSFTWLVQGLKKIREKLVHLEREYHRKVIVQQASGNPEATRVKIAALLVEAQTALDAAEYSKAEQLFVDVVGIDPKSVEAYLGLADVAAAQKNYRNAREALQFALKLHTGTEAAYVRLGRISSQEGNLAEAESDYMKSVALNTQTAGTHFELAEIEEKLGHIDRASQEFSEAIKLEPANPKYLDGLLQFAIRNSRLDLARETWERLQQANPENQKLLDYKASMENLAKTAASTTYKKTH
jgi:tetratricopeptide (TPR) repeat protein